MLITLSISVHVKLLYCVVSQWGGGRILNSYLIGLTAANAAFNWERELV